MGGLCSTSQTTCSWALGPGLNMAGGGSACGEGSTGIKSGFEAGLGSKDPVPDPGGLLLAAGSHPTHGLPWPAGLRGSPHHQQFLLIPTTIGRCKHDLQEPSSHPQSPCLQGLDAAVAQGLAACGVAPGSRTRQACCDSSGSAGDVPWSCARDTDNGEEGT